MINIIKADLYRIVRNKAFYIAVAILLLMLGMSIYMVQPGMIGMTTASPEYESMGEMSDMSYEELNKLTITDMREMMLKTEDYELDRDIAGQNMNLYYVFIFIASIIITTDFSNKSVKNTLSSAISRNKYFFSKILLVNLICVALLLLNNYLAHFGNIIFNSEDISASIGDITKVTLLQIPPVLASTSLLTGFAFMIRKNAVFNTVSIPFVMVFQVIASLAVQLLNISPKFLNYELQAMFMYLSGEPTDNYIRNSFIVCAVIVIVFNAIGYMCFKKSEIK
ncbi:MAG: ABC transporter permease [Ruminococcus flavefaciens]|nr:ABC transporter permease [Ruminococcus flavefaciens]MCM1230321.1 ABC transporter permease [Ruminococcus flavefaciens]